MHLEHPGRRVRALWLPRADRVLVQWGHDLPELHARGHAGALWTGNEALDVARVAVAPNGETFVHPSANLTRVNVMDVQSGAPVAHSPVSASPTIEAIAYAPDSRSVVWSTYAPPYDYGEVESWELGAPVTKTVDTETSRTTTVGFSGEAAHALVAFGSRIAVYAAGERWTRAWSHEVGVYAVQLVPVVGRAEAVAVSQDGDVAVFDVVSGAVRWRVGGGREAMAVHVHPRGQLVAFAPRFAAGEPRPLVVRRVGGDETLTVPASALGAWCEARWMGATERLVVRTTTDVCVYDLTDGSAQLRSTWTSPAGELTALATSADGAIACGTERGDVFVL